MRSKSTTFLRCYLFGVTGLLMPLTFGGLTIWWTLSLALPLLG